MIESIIPTLDAFAYNAIDYMQRMKRLISKQQNISAKQKESQIEDLDMAIEICNEASNKYLSSRIETNPL